MKIPANSLKPVKSQADRDRPRVGPRAHAFAQVRRPSVPDRLGGPRDRGCGRRFRSPPAPWPRTPREVVATAAAPRASSGPAGIRIKAGALVNAATDQILWSDNLNTERPIGSIVKVMTAMVVIGEGDLNQVITVPKSVIAYLKSQDQPSVAGLIVGDRLTAQELLEALLLPSGCDAAYTLAMTYGPGITAFIAKMNALAQQLDLTSTLLLELRRDAVADRALRLVDPGEPDHDGPGRDAVPGVPGHRGPEQLPAPGRSRAPRLPLAERQPADRHVARATRTPRDRDQVRRHQGREELPAVRGDTGRPDPDRRDAGHPGDDICDTGPVATKVLNWGFAYF